MLGFPPALLPGLTQDIRDHGYNEDGPSDQMKELAPFLSLFLFQSLAFCLERKQSRVPLSVLGPGLSRPSWSFQSAGWPPSTILPKLGQQLSTLDMGKVEL